MEAEMFTNNKLRSNLVEKFGPEGGAAYDAMLQRILEKFDGKMLGDVQAGLLAELEPIYRLMMQPAGDLNVSVDTADPTRLVIDGTGDYAEWLRAAQERMKNRGAG
jgi:hypothetical protein